MSHTLYHLISHMQHKERAKMITSKHSSKMQCTIPFIIHPPNTVYHSEYISSVKAHTDGNAHPPSVVTLYSSSLSQCHEWPWGKGQGSSLSL